MSDTAAALTPIVLLAGACQSGTGARRCIAGPPVARWLVDSLRPSRPSTLMSGCFSQSEQLKQARATPLLTKRDKIQEGDPEEKKAKSITALVAVLL